MKKSDLILELAKRHNLTEKTAMQIVDLIFDGFTDTLKKGGKVEIHGFASFTIREYGAYIGRNPKTGKTSTVKPKKLPYFRVGRELKNNVDFAARP